MEYSQSSSREQHGIEKFVLILFTLYNAAILLLTMLQGWEGWIAFVLVLNPVVCWILSARGYLDYRGRALITTGAMQISIWIYIMRTQDIPSVMAIFAAFIVFSGLYGIVDVLHSSWVSSLLMVFYYVFIEHRMAGKTPEESAQILVQLANIFVLQYAIYIWASRRAQTNSAFQETIETLQKAEQSKDDFMANVSHEIRTPINTICGISEILLSETETEKIREDIRSIQSAGRNLMSVVSDVLDFSELQAGKVELEEEAYNITSSINDIINMALAKKNEKKIELIVNCDADIPCALYGDEKKIRRVISNILDNAIKFTKEGYVGLSVTSRKEGADVELEITIKDTGIGMKEESIEKLFTSFNQVDTKRNREEDGLGLGLAISQALVQCMGGVLTINSHYEEGTIVHIAIPQKILDERPIVCIPDKEKLNAAVYINMEQFRMPEMREEYAENIQNIIDQLQTRCHICRNFAELKQIDAEEKLTHVFTSGVEYRADSQYFDELAKRVKVVTVIDTEEEKDIANPQIFRIYKPFYILSIASVLNGEVRSKEVSERIHQNGFMAPMAHVLVVDDNEMNLQVIEALLERYRIQVTKAASGWEALKKIEEMNYDFVFMDHMMPEMDGVETLHRIREKEGTYYQEVPVIALTANAIAGAREKFLEEGFSDFLEKPIEVSVLERVLRRNLPPEKLNPVEREILKNEETEEGAGNEGQSGLDEKAGLLYCGGEAGYRKVLECCCHTGDENCKTLETLYQTEDWKNYTIVVHGIKSAMLSIGAMHLSELAKQLEAAGKKNDISYIKEHHVAMLEEYCRTIEMLKEKYAENDKTLPDEFEQLPVLSDSMFDQSIQELEDAMYELDGEQMLHILTELERYQYAGASLKRELAVVRRKVEMSDYMSAVDVLIKLRERLRKGGYDYDEPSVYNENHECKE